MTQNITTAIALFFFTALMIGAAVLFESSSDEEETTAEDERGSLFEVAAEGFQRASADLETWRNMEFGVPTGLVPEIGPVGMPRDAAELYIAQNLKNHPVLPLDVVEEHFPEVYAQMARRVSDLIHDEGVPADQAILEGVLPGLKEIFAQYGPALRHLPLEKLRELVVAEIDIRKMLIAEIGLERCAILILTGITPQTVNPAEAARLYPKTMETTRTLLLLIADARNPAPGVEIERAPPSEQDFVSVDKELIAAGLTEAEFKALTQPSIEDKETCLHQIAVLEWLATLDSNAAQRVMGELAVASATTGF